MVDTTLWIIIGFIGQGLFSARFIIQCGSIAKRSSAASCRWPSGYFSLGGGIVLTAYAVHRMDPVFIVGQTGRSDRLFPQSGLDPQASPGRRRGAGRVTMPLAAAIFPLGALPSSWCSSPRSSGGRTSPSTRLKASAWPGKWCPVATGSSSTRTASPTITSRRLFWLIGAGWSVLGVSD